MIEIDLNLFVTLSKYLPEKNECLEIKKNTTVEKLMADLGVPVDMVKLVFINGKREQISYQLKNGDRVGIFPPIGGG